MLCCVAHDTVLPFVLVHHLGRLLLLLFVVYCCCCCAHCLMLWCAISSAPLLGLLYVQYPHHSQRHRHTSTNVSVSVSSTSTRSTSITLCGSGLIHVVVYSPHTLVARTKLRTLLLLLLQLLLLLLLMVRGGEGGNSCEIDILLLLHHIHIHCIHRFFQTFSSQVRYSTYALTVYMRLQYIWVTVQ